MILVTGGAGFIGANFVLDWMARDAEPVVNLDALTYAGNLESLKSLAGDRRHVFVQGDIRDRSLLESLLAEHQPRAIVHLAAESHVDRSIHGPGEFIKTNVEGTYTLLETACAYWNGLDRDRKAAFRFHHVSTDEVYGSLRPDQPPFTEANLYEPNSPYSATKAASDHLVRAWHHTYGLPVVTTNCSNNYGPYQFPEKLIPLMIVNALAGKPLPVYGDGQQVRDWLYVKDHCAAIREVLARGRPGQTYNIGGWNEKPNIDIVRTVCALLDTLRPDPAGSHARLITHVADRPGHDRRYAIDARKMEKRARLAAGRNVRDRHRKDGALVSRPSAVGLARAKRLLSRLGRAQLWRENRRMKILLFGKDGQVGWELQRALAPLGVVIPLGRSGNAGTPVDLTDTAALVAAVRAIEPQAIVNAAAYTAVDKAEGDAERAHAINAAAPAVLAREAAALNAWLVHYSSDYVFDGSGSKPWSEQDPAKPLNVYGRTKLEGEQAVRDIAPRHLILRTSWVYGVRGSNFIRTMLALAQERDRLTVIDDQHGAPTGAELLADLTALALRTAIGNAAVAGTYHAVASGETTWYGYARHVVEYARAAGLPVKVPAQRVEPVPTSAFPTAARRPLNSRMDTRKLRDTFGLALPDWRAGVDRMLNEVVDRWR